MVQQLDQLLKSLGYYPIFLFHFYMPLRHLIAGKLPCYEMSGEIEEDEIYFGGVRKGKRGRGAAGMLLSSVY